MSIHAANPYKSEQLTAILRALSRGMRTTAELHEVSGSQAVSTRISELRSIGYVISCIRKGGVYFYTWEGVTP